MIKRVYIKLYSLYDDPQQYMCNIVLHYDGYLYKYIVYFIIIIIYTPEGLPGDVEIMQVTCRGVPEIPCLVYWEGVHAGKSETSVVCV